MNLLRGFGRAMLAGYFVVNGVKAIRRPDEWASVTKPVLDKVVPLAQQALPDSVSGYIPDDPRSMARLCGGVSILGGLGMALGLAPRAGACLAAATMGPQLLAAWPIGADDPEAARNNFVRAVALTGAALVVSQDTRGYPSLMWQAKDARARTIRAAEQRKKDAAKLAKKASKGAKRG